MSKIIAAAAAAFTMAWGGSALADVTILQSSGTAAFVAHDNFALPGAGKYKVSITSSRKITMEATGGYEHHWDWFVAPPPKPHTDFIEGNNSSFWDTKYGEYFSLDWTFVVPETQYTFFGAPAWVESMYGIPTGTPLYEEVRAENPYMRIVLADLGDVDFDYSILVTQITAVPEPATWAMMITGFGLTGLAIRRRRSPMAAAQAA
jgi:hypothetical protein